MSPLGLAQVLNYRDMPEIIGPVKVEPLTSFPRTPIDRYDYLEAETHPITSLCKEFVESIAVWQSV